MDTIVSLLLSGYNHIQLVKDIIVSNGEPYMKKSMIYHKIHLNVNGQRTTININIYLTALFLIKRTGKYADPLNLTDTNVSDARRIIQREIDSKNARENFHIYMKHRLKERVEEFLIKQIADPKLLKVTKNS